MSRRFSLILLWFGALAVSTVACAGDLAIDDMRVRETIPGQRTGSGYFSLVNNGQTACTLAGVSSPAAGRVEVHEHRHSDGAMRMRRVDKLVVDAGAEVTFEPGGYHLMLLDLERPLKRGETVTVRLDFGDCGVLTGDFPVVAVGHR